MPLDRRHTLCVGLVAISWGLLSGLLISPAHGAKVILKDGRILDGRFTKIPALQDKPRAQREDGPEEAKRILVCDDKLKRTYVSTRHVQQVLEKDNSEIQEKFLLPQRTAQGGKRVQSVGGLLEITPFDEFGRRRYTMRGSNQLDIIQGITEITPQYCRVEGISHVWDQRIATTSLEKELLDLMLRRCIDDTNVDQRLKIARFYVQSERFNDAKRELDQISADFPDIRQQAQSQIQALAQLGARLALNEVKIRKDAGQHSVATAILSQMPTENVSGELLQAAREELEDYRNAEERGKTLLAKLTEYYDELETSVLKDKLKPLLDEVTSELNYNTLERLNAFERFVPDENMKADEKVSLALSGWLTGAAGAVSNITIAVSLSELRELLIQYFNAKDKIAQGQIFDQISEQEGATPELISSLISFMKPPLPLPEANAEMPGYFELTARRLADEPPITYLVQLPPDYDPHRFYPVIVTLHGERTTPSQQMEWWAGAWSEQRFRMGHATRNGYIVIAPAWARDNQRQYDFSASSHAAVLNSLRDACRRFSIDMDRVYLSGHFMGGDAAWDLALAHPDLWAGVIPVGARADQYVKVYWQNAKYVPLYFVSGELDGDKPEQNAESLQRYINGAFNVTLTEYIGRGPESFQDEILGIFNWMKLQRRDFFPREFSCSTLRHWDNYFWWVEIGDVPDRYRWDPPSWPPPKQVRTGQVEAKINANGDLYIKASAEKITLWLSPQLMDLTARVNIYVNGARLSRKESLFRPDLATLLEDVHTRGDRQHPFWIRFEAR